MAAVIFSAALALSWVATATATELIPERYLRPRDFNHHPFTDVGEAQAAALKQQGGVLPDVHPYAILASKRPREGRNFPEQGEVYYPNPPAAVLPRKPAVQIHHEPSQYLQADPYNTIPKNYAFSYSVKDKHSGDDFSHSQAHNGQATRGQYRVKLPDGRVQVVSYTADHKGYRADVQYEGAAAAVAHQPATPIYESTSPAPAVDNYIHQAPQQYVQQSYTPTPPTYFQPAHQYVQSSYTATPSPYQQEHAFSPTPAPYHQHAYSPTPAPYQQEQVFSPTPAPYQRDQSYSPTPPSYHQAYSATPATYESYVSPTAGYRQLSHYNSPDIYATTAPEQNQQPYSAPEQNFASPSPITFPTSAPDAPPSYATSSPGLQAYASGPSGAQYEPASQPEYEQNYRSPAPSPFAIQPHLRSSPAPFARHQFVTSTESPSLGHIIVTPRAQRSSNPNSGTGASRRIFGARQHVIYRLKSTS